MEDGSGRAEKIGRLAARFDAGDLAAAEDVARGLVADDPRDEQALHFLAQILFRQGQAKKIADLTQEAADLMKTVLEIDPTNASYNNDYGVMLAALGRWWDAAAAYEMASVLDRNHFDARFNLALALFHIGQRERARAGLDQVLALRPDLPDALALDGELLRAEGEPAKAVEAFRKAIERGSETPIVHVNLGLALREAGRDEEALEAVRVAERIGDADANTCFQLGNFYRGEGKTGDKDRGEGKTGDKALAERHYRRALALFPDFSEAYNNLGLVLRDSDPLQAMECFVYALMSNPACVSAHINLGSMRAQDGLFEASILNFKYALKLDPRSVNARNGLALAYQCMHRLDESEQAFRRSLEVQPEGSEAQTCLGVLLLLCGRYREGWPYYENRWRVPDRIEKRPEFSQPEWTGDDLGSRTLLVYTEQGYGDNLQFARYLPLLHRRYPQAKLYYWCLPPLLRLFKSHAAGWGVELQARTAELPPLSFDARVALLSLPLHLDTTLEDIPADIPYLASPPELIEKWATRLGPLPGKRVGLVWSGSESYLSQKRRSVRLKQFGPLLEVGGIHWVSLQKGKEAGQIAEEDLTGRIIDVMDEVEDFADTAAIIANLDLVIGVDTAVLHLAGAMGKPVWLLNRFDTDWRWLLEREDSPWYPTLRIFRQTSFGDWDSVVSRVAETLTGWVIEGGSDPVWTLDVPGALLKAAPASGADDSPDARVLAKQVFGDERLNYRIAHARHGWMLVNPNDVYIGQSLLEYGEYSEIESACLHRCLFKPGRIVEIGANMGSHTIGLAKAAAARGEQMLVFEPQPVVFQNLCANLALNGLRNVRAWPFACGDETGMVTLAEPDYARPGNFGGVEVSRTEDGPGRVAVPCVRLDDFVGEGDVALVKIDVEGFELAVLRGADETLRRWRPILYVENNGGDESKALIEWLWSRGYRLFWHIPPLFNPGNFFGRPANRYGNIVSCNMICMPKEFLEGDLPGLDEIVDSSEYPLSRK
ncbi:MAG: FkbM family methyltransferase [Candidatus Accumulibacter sp.]|jgi:FkbM family methyltransferase|nr:FkbM family methyltransferase [Accumulibacter sp.]